MNYTLDLNDRPFKAILAGTKKVEGRTNTDIDKTPYNKLSKDNTITFTNNVTGQKLAVVIRFIHHYKSVSEMLTIEGVENVLSSEPKTINHGVESFNSLIGYKEGIVKNGIYAIGIKLKSTSV